MVRTLRAELGSDHGTVKRVAEQLGYGVESVRLWVHQADIDDGHERGMTTDEAARVRELEQEVRELRRANEILNRAASFLGAELDRQHRRIRGPARRQPWKTVEDVELATLGWMHWHNTTRLSVRGPVATVHVPGAIPSRLFVST
jgi:transposase-like protein